MVHLKNTYLVCTIIVYCIKIVSSLTLDLDHLRRSVFEIVKSAEGNLTKTMIYSTPDKAITTVRQGYIMIWEGQHGEKAKCVTHFKFKRPARSLVKIDVVKNNINTVLYFFKDFKYYKCISKDLFEKKYNELSNYFKDLESIDVDQLVTKTKKPRKRKRTGDTDDTEGAKKKPAQSQQLEPETTHVEISSDDETDTASEVESEDIMPHREEILDKLKMKIQQRMKEKSQPPTEPEPSTEPDPSTEPEPQQLEPEVVQVEMESDDESTDTASEEGSSTTELSTTQQSDPENTIIEISSDDETDTASEDESTELSTYSQTAMQESQQLESVTTQVELSSDDEKTDSASEDSTYEERKHREEILEKLKKKIQQRMKEKSQQSDPENIIIEISSDDETDTASEDESTELSTTQQSDPESTMFQISSDDTASEDESEELTEEQKEQKKQLIMEKINFVVSSDSDSEVDTSEPTNEQITQSDAITQPEHENLEPETTHVESDDDEDDDDLLNDLLVEEDVEKLLERELKDIGFSQAEIDSLFEETTEDVTEGDSSKD